MKVQAEPSVMAQMIKRKIRPEKGDLAGIVEREQANGSPNGMTVLGLEKHAVRSTEPVRTKGTKRVIAIYVRSAKRPVKVERDIAAGAGVRSCDHGYQVQVAHGTARTAAQARAYRIRQPTLTQPLARKRSPM